MISSRSLYLCCALLVLSAASALCTPVQYSDRPSWLSAVSSPSTVTFEADPLNFYNTAGGFTTGLELSDNPTFVGMESINGSWSYDLQLVNLSLGPWYNYNSGTSMTWAANTTTYPAVNAFLQVTWPTPVTAVAFDFMTYISGPAYNVKLNNNADLVFATSPSPGNPNRGFFGLTSDTPISTIAIYLPPNVGDTPLIDNLSYGTAGSEAPADVPEPRTLLLIAGGLMGMPFVRRLRRNKRRV